MLVYVDHVLKKIEESENKNKRIMLIILWQKINRNQKMVSQSKGGKDITL